MLQRLSTLAVLACVSAPVAAVALLIEHQGVACVTADKFPQLEVRRASS